jgi:hypothetical protein
MASLPVVHATMEETAMGTTAMMMPLILLLLLWIHCHHPLS